MFEELPLALRFLIALVLLAVIVVVFVALLIALARWLGWMKPRQHHSRQNNVRTESDGHLMRRLILRIAEAVAIFQVLVLTILGMIGGAASSRMMYVMGAAANPNDAMAMGAIIGGALAFLFSISFVAILFALTGIERNTRNTARFLELIASPPPHQ